MTLMLCGQYLRKQCRRACTPTYVASFGDFLSLPRTSIHAQVLGSRFNHSAGYGLEIPDRFIFQCHEKGVEWARK